MKRCNKLKKEAERVASLKAAGKNYVMQGINYPPDHPSIQEYKNQISEMTNFPRTGGVVPNKNVVVKT